MSMRYLLDKKRAAGLLISGFIVALIAGCGSTTAQLQVQNTVSLIQIAADQWKTCQIKLADRPNYTVLHARVHLVEAEPLTLEQRVDDGVLHPEVRYSLFDWNKELQQCRSALLIASEHEFPFLYETFVQDFAAVDDVFVDLERNLISWGEANTRLTAIASDFRAKIRAAARPWAQSMDRMHEAELDNRRAVWNGLAEVLATGVQVAADVYVKSRPTRTTCQDYRLGFNCTTRTW